AASIASLVFMAGDVRIAAANSMLMIHAPWSYASGNAEQLRDAADALDAWAAAMASSYSEATGKSKDEILAILTDGKDHYWTADEALAEGYATQIGDAIPAAAHARHLAELQARFTPQQDPPAAAAASTTETTMTTPVTTPAAQTPSAADLETIRAQAIAEDATRRAGIAQAASRHMSVMGMADLVASLQADPKVSIADAGLKILAKIAEGAGPIAGQHTVRTIEDETDKRKDAAAWALMARAGVIPEKLRAEAQAKLNGNPFRGQRLEDMARASLDRAGIDYRGKDRMEVVASAFTQSTSDFGILLENAMHKTLQQAYAAAADTWRRFCAVGSVSDFRDHPRYRLAALQNLKALNELGEFENAPIPDGERARVRIGTKGLIITLSRQAIINDDLGAFIGLSNQLGRASARTIESDVYTLLALNGGLGPVMDDGKTLFHVDHGNIGTGAALSQDSVDADRVLMTQQREPGGQDFLSLSPSILLVGSSMRAKAIEVNGAEFNESTAKNAGDRRPNTVRGLYADIIDTPRIAGTRRYSFTAPSNAPVLEVDFLDGNEQPFLEQETGFTVDGTKFKVRHDFGVSAVDFRGATTNAGQ
ncbi:MAG: ClpP-like prohead protease/major capsid protein fusion protein, partial [Arenimonas sp.]